MGQTYSRFIGGILLAFSVLTIFAIYLTTNGGFGARSDLVNKLGIFGVPNPDFFKFIWWIFILTASFGLFLVSYDIGIIWRWVIFLILIFLLAFFLFGTNGFNLLPLALVTAVFLVILLGETIYYVGFNLQNKIVCALLGFIFIWTIYSLYFIFALLINLLSYPEVLCDS